MRKVKDAKDLSSNELIYFKSHAKATYMSDGSTIEDAINSLLDHIKTLEETIEQLTQKTQTVIENNTLKFLKGATVENNTLKLISGNVYNNKLIL